MNKYELMVAIEKAAEAEMQVDKEILLACDEVTEAQWKQYQCNVASTKLNYDFAMFVLEMNDKLDKILEKLEQ